MSLILSQACEFKDRPTETLILILPNRASLEEVLLDTKCIHFRENNNNNEKALNKVQNVDWNSFILLWFSPFLFYREQIF